MSFFEESEPYIIEKMATTKKTTRKTTAKITTKRTTTKGKTVATGACYCCTSGAQACKYVWKEKGTSVGSCVLQSGKSKAQCIGQSSAVMGYSCTASYSYTTTTASNGVAKIPTYKYSATDPNFSNISEDAYCLQKGRPGPDGGQNWSYSALDNFDISTCKSSSDNYQCGLAEIMCQTMDITTDENGKFSVNGNNKYSYSTISSALRSWVAYDNSSIHDGSGVSTGGSGDSGFDYYSSTDVYSRSANYYLSGNGEPLKCPSTCSKNSSTYGVLCYTNETEKKNIEDLVSVLKNTKSGTSCLDKLNETLNGKDDDATDGDITYGSPDINLNFDKNSETVTVKVSFKNMKVGTKLVSSSTEIVEVPVEYCTEGSNGCNVVIEAFDSKGNKLTLVNGVLPSTCKKNYCEVKYSYKQLCEQSNNNYQDEYVTAKVTVYTKKAGAGVKGAGALIKNYVKASGEVSQQFVSFDVNGIQDLLNGNGNQGGSSDGGSHEETETELTKGPIYTVKGTPVCPCDNKKRCDDFTVKNTLPNKCTDYGNFNKGLYDTYDEGKLEEPYMNCIMNACNVSQRNQYDFSSEYGVDVGICRIFCREEVEFYLANKTRVYAGMQFKYKIDEILGSKRKLTNGNSLTSMVLQKRQCATEIYYDHRNPLYNYSTSSSKYNSYIQAGYNTWQKMYGKAVQEMVDAWTNWKAYETLHINEGWGSCNPKLNHADEGECKSGASSCGGSCTTTSTYPAFDYVYTWPYSGSPRYTNSSTGNPGYSYNDKSQTTTNKVTFNIRNKTDTPGDQDGKYNKSSGTSSEECGLSYSCPTETEPNKTCRNSKCIVTSSCEKGEPGKDKCKVKNKESALWSAFKSSVDKVTQLIYELENCNLYSSSELKLYYDSASYVDFSGYVAGGRTKYQGKYSSAIDGGTTKDYILKLANCESEENCISLELDYDDLKYGSSTIFGKEVETITQSEDIKKQEQQTYYCVNDEKEKKRGNSYEASCYPGPGNSDKDLTGGNTLGKHDLVSCSGYNTGAKCQKNQVSGSQIELPINDFAIFTVVSEADFWQPKKYSTEAYTGSVFEGSGNGSNTTSLGDYVFPVSMDKESGGATGAYDIRHKYTYVGSALSKAQLLNENYYEYTCQYEVYNITNLYDCNVGTDSDGNADLGTCNNKCYEIEDGVPIIRTCASWTDRDKDTKGYGFIYRNVELGNLFPAERKIGNNWSIHNDAINSIQDTASDMYSNSDRYLEYSYTLTSDAIKKIRNYNKDRNGAGGYIDNTLRDCDSYDGFYNCSSTFLDLFRDNSNSFGIIVDKSDGTSLYSLGE